MMGQRFFDYGRELKVHFYENEKKIKIRLKDIQKTACRKQVVIYKGSTCEIF